MDYFKNVQSLSELKAQYRQLVLANHPDKGGDTEVMQVINDALKMTLAKLVQRMNIPNMYMQNTGGLEVITLPATIPRS